jgi:signal transduction histidine kinase
MSLRARILLLLAIVAGAVFMMAAMVYLTIRGMDFYNQRVALAYQQLAAMTEVAKSANRYAGQTAEVLLLGEQKRADLVNARAEVEASFVRLERVTRAEMAFLEGRRDAEVATEAPEFDQIESLRQLYRDIDRSVERLFWLRDDGRQAAAMEVFSAEIEKRLDTQLAQLLSDAVEGEREEVAHTEAAAADFSARLTIALAIGALLSLTISVGAAILLSRALSGSIGRLMEGAAAIGRGDLGHRIPEAGKDEMAVLSRQFNEMAQRLGDQQRSLMLAKQELESQVLERTAALQQANARLQHLDRSRVRFLADISHELRTPLTVVRGEAEVSLRGTGRPEQEYRETLEQIVQQAAEMSRLVEDLLFLARSESDTIALEMRPVILQEVLGEALAAGQALTAPDSVRLEQRWADEPILVQADPQRLKQAVVILIDNAIKYSEKADVVRVSAKANGRFAEVSVVDHGPGIPGDDLPYVFERFYRGGAGRSRELGGSGLGLPIAKWIAENHGGTISVTSEPYRETEFKIRLPMARRFDAATALVGERVEQ